MTCDRCGHELGIGDYPFCKGNASDHQGGHYGVIPDDIPGGLVIEHGLCHEDGSPRTYYSRTEINREAKRRGWTPFVRHIGERGSDKSPHTSRWV